MSVAIDLLRVATAAGARFTVSGDRLTVTAPRPLPAEFVDQLRRAKGEVIALLAADRVSSLEERAAIVEYGAAVPRSWAEGFARLDPARPPADVPLRRWQQFIDDVGRFLDTGSPRRPRRSAGRRSTFSVAIETDRLHASISKACAG